MSANIQSGALRSIVQLPTHEAYDAWASTYDTDGNILQALDDQEVESWLLPTLIKTAGYASSAVKDQGPTKEGEERIVVDLGCGTGRTTLRIATSLPGAQILSLDNSRGMLAVAASKTPLSLQQRITYAEFDIFNSELSSQTPAHIHLRGKGGANAVVSTLVIEHIPLRLFFANAVTLLQSNGFLLITNMHSDMGLISQAGFVDEKGRKVRGYSHAHSLFEVLDEAGKWGFESLQTGERAVKPEDLSILGPRASKWTGINCWYGVLLQRKKVQSPCGDDER